jgi:hypothetical protein
VVGGFAVDSGSAASSRLDKYRYFAEAHLSLFRERLHGIEYAVSTAIALKDINGHGACGMHKELILPTLRGMSYHFPQGTVLHADDTDFGIWGKFCQRATVDTHHLMSCSL